MHRRVEGGVFAAAAALGWHLVGELVVDGHLVAVGDLLHGEGERDGADLLVVDDTGRDFREGVPDLAGEDAGVEFGDKLGGVGSFHVLCLIDELLFAPGRQGLPFESGRLLRRLGVEVVGQVVQVNDWLGASRAVQALDH